MRSLIIAVLAIACVPATLGYAQDGNSERPNVVLIIMDDLGWADVGASGSPDVRTPYIDSLARDGISAHGISTRTGRHALRRAPG